MSDYLPETWLWEDCTEEYTDEPTPPTHVNYHSPCDTGREGRVATIYTCPSYLTKQNKDRSTLLSSTAPKLPRRHSGVEPYTRSFYINTVILLNGK